MPRSVFTRVLRDHRTTMIGWSLGIVAFVAIELAAFPSVRSASGLDQIWDQMPDAMKAMFGMEGAVDLTSGVGFLEAELFGFTIPLVVLILGIVVGSKVVAGSEDDGILELVLAQPVTRARLLLEGAAAAVVVVAVPIAAMFLTLVVGAPLVDIDVSTGHLALACLRLVLLAVLFTVLAVGVGAAVGGRSRAAVVCAVCGFAAFLAATLGRLVDVVEVVGRLSPFEWLLGTHPISSTSWAGLLVAAGLAALVLGAGLLAFERRDLR